MSKTVVISGCSSGIGYASVLGVLASGYRVIATVRTQEDAARLLADVKQTLQQSVEFDVVIMDLADSESVATAASEVLALTDGDIYALFNNAAYGQPGAVEDLTRETLSKQFETNLFGTHQITTLLLPALLKQESARIIQNSSILGFIGMPMRGAYVASKFALEGLSATLRMELSETSVRVSIIEPGPIVSKFRENALAALRQNINFSTSRHAWRYEAAVKRLSKAGPTSKDTLGPEAVVEKLLHALSAKRPRNRYYVTRPTYIMAFLTRILPSRYTDRILLAAAKAE